MVSTLIIHVRTWITTHLPTPDGWKAVYTLRSLRRMAVVTPDLRLVTFLALHPFHQYKILLLGDRHVYEQLVWGYTRQHSG